MVRFSTPRYFHFVVLIVDFPRLSSTVSRLGGTGGLLTSTLLSQYFETTPFVTACCSILRVYWTPRLLMYDVIMMSLCRYWVGMRPPAIAGVITHASCLLLWRRSDCCCYHVPGSPSCASCGWCLRFLLALYSSRWRQPYLRSLLVKMLHILLAACLFYRWMCKCQVGYHFYFATEWLILTIKGTLVCSAKTPGFV